MAKWWQNLINAIDFFDLYHTDTETEMRNPSQPWSSIGDGVSKVYDDVTGNTAIDKSLEAQSTENQKNRDYNMMLWNQENAYNSPSAQKARLQAAGLNSDMMYGGSGVQNTASSPAPSTPMDWSSLANKKSVGQSVMDSLSIEQARANIEKTKGEAKSLGYDNDIRQQMIDKGFIIEQLEYDKLKEDMNLVYETARGIDYDNTLKEVEHSFAQIYRQEIFENKLQQLATSTKMSANALKEDVETLALRIAGINAENSKLVRLSKFTTDEKKMVLTLVLELLKAL